MKFFIVDVFSDCIFGGNPAGIVILSDGEEFPEYNTMKKTAAELRYSETAFVKRIDKKNFKTRYFTPSEEVELCGHATIGAFFSLMKLGMVEPGEAYKNDTLAGKLEIKVNDDTILMDMAEPQIFENITENKELSELYGIMGLSEQNQGMFFKNPEINLTPKKVSVGLPDIMMPVKDEEQLEKIEPDFIALTELSKKYNVVGVHAFTCNTKDGYIHARNFAPLYEIDEEAATGTSNGALTFYLYNYGIIKSGDINTVIQGEKMGRPSKISTYVAVEDGDPRVKVGGFAAALAMGEINL